MSLDNIVKKVTEDTYMVLENLKIYSTGVLYARQGTYINTKQYEKLQFAYTKLDAFYGN